MNLSKFEKLKNLEGPVLLTGHTGFKGTWMTLLLIELGVKVYGYSLEPEGDSLYLLTNSNGRIPEKFADIRNFKEISNYINEIAPSAIIHMAAQPLVLESYESPLETFETNLMGTTNLLTAAFESPSVKTVQIVTTDKVYKNNDSGLEFQETDALGGKDPYSASKVAAESAVDAWRSISKTKSGPNVFSVRAGNVIGGGDLSKNRLMPDIIKSLKSDKKILIRNRNSTRPWQHALDPLFGYLLALESSLNNIDTRAFNFGPNEKSLRVQDVIEVVLGSTNLEVDFNSNMMDEKLRMESEKLDLNSNLAREQLGWVNFWTQETAINSTLEWWDKVLSKKISPYDACLSDIKKIISNE